MKTTAQSTEITNAELCRVMKENTDFKFTDAHAHVPALHQYIISKLNLTEGDVETCPDLDEKICMFTVNMSSKYEKFHRVYDQLKESFTKTPSTFSIPEPMLEKMKEKEFKQLEDEKKSQNVPPPIQRVLRVAKPFSEKSKRSQQYASAAFRQSHEPEAIILAASQQSTPLGRLIKRTNTIRSKTVEKVLNAVDNNVKPLASYQKKSPEEALGHILNNSLTKEQYLNMKSTSDESGANIWPNYNKILEAKAQCRPDGIVVKELDASVPLQNLLDHTAKRILQTDPDVVKK